MSTPEEEMQNNNSFIPDSMAVDSNAVDNFELSDTEDADLIIDPKYKDKVEKYKQTMSSDPKHVRGYIERLKREEGDVVKQNSKAAEETSEKTKVTERLEDKESASAIYNFLDEELGGDDQVGINENGQINYNYTYDNQTFLGIDFLNPDDEVAINDDNVEEWLDGGYKMGDEHLDNLIDKKVNEQINSEIVASMRKGEYNSIVYTDEDKLALRNAYRQQYKSDLAYKRSEYEAGNAFSAALELEQNNVEIPTENMRFGNYNVTAPGYGMEEEEAEAARQHYAKNVAYGNLYANTLNKKLENYQSNSPELYNLYEAQEKATIALEELEKNNNGKTSKAYAEAVENVERLRGELQFGGYLKDEDGEYTVPEGQIQSYLDLASNFQNELEYLYDLENPETVHTLKNAWLKNQTLVNTIQAEIDKIPKQDSQSAANQPITMGGVPSMQAPDQYAPLRNKLGLKLLRVKAKQEALDHYYLLNHRYLESKEASETHAFQHFGKGFVRGMGLDNFTTSVIFQDNEYKEKAALDLLYQYSIPLSNEEVSNTQLSGGEEVGEFLGDVTALGVKLFASRGLINPIFLGGGRLATALASIKALKKVPKIQRGLAYMAKNGLLGAYYSSKVGAGRKFVEGTKLIDKIGILTIEGGLEELTFKTIGGQTGQGFGFGIGHRLPINLLGKWRPKKEFAAVFKKFTNPKLNQAVGATASMEMAGITESAWELLAYDDTFKEKFDELIPSFVGEGEGNEWKDSLGRRLLFNLAMNGILSTSAAYNPYSLGNIVRRKKTYNPTTGEYGISGIDQIVDQYKKDFTIRKDKLIEAINYFENSTPKGGEIYADVIKELKENLQDVHKFSLTVDNYIFKKVIVDKSAFDNPNGETTLGVVENAASDLMSGMINVVVSKNKNWKQAFNRLLNEYNAVNKQLYDAEPANAEELLKELETGNVLNFVNSLYTAQDDAELRKATALKRHGVVRETIFANGLRHRIRYNNRLNQYKQYWKRRGADGVDRTLTDAEVNQLRKADVKEANNLFEYEKNRDLSEKTMYGDGTSTGGSRDVIEVSTNNISDRLKKAKQSSKDGAKNGKTVRALNLINKLYNILPANAQSRYVLHSTPGTLNRVIKTRALEMRSEAISLFNQGVLTKEEFSQETRRIRDWSFQASKNPFISGSKNTIHIDVTHSSNILKKDLGTVLAHESAHPLLSLIQKVSPESYASLEKQMMSDKKYKKKYLWALKQYGFSDAQMQKMRLSLTQADFEALQDRKKTVLNETMAQWFGETMNASSLSYSPLKVISKPLYNAYSKVFGNPMGELVTSMLSENNVSPHILTLNDISDLSSLTNKINRAVRNGRSLKFDPSIKMPEEMSDNIDHFNLIDESRIFSELNNKENLSKPEFNKLNNLVLARQMRQQGESGLSIHQKTGFFMSRSGQIVSYEGPLHVTEKGKKGLFNATKVLYDSYKQDSEAKLSMEFDLSQIFDGPAFLYYPKLKSEVKVKINFTDPKDANSPVFLEEAQVYEEGFNRISGKDNVIVEISLSKDLLKKAFKDGSNVETLWEALNQGRKEGSMPLAADNTYNRVLQHLDLSGDKSNTFKSNTIDALSITNIIAHEVQHYMQHKESTTVEGGNRLSSMRVMQGLYINDSFGKNIKENFDSFNELSNLSPEEVITKILGAEQSSRLNELRTKLFKYSLYKKGGQEWNTFEDMSGAEQFKLYVEYQDMVESVSNKLISYGNEAFMPEFLNLAVNETLQLLDKVREVDPTYLRDRLSDSELIKITNDFLEYDKFVKDNTPVPENKGPLRGREGYNEAQERKENFFNGISEQLETRNKDLNLEEAKARLEVIIPLVKSFERYERLDGEVEARAVQSLNQGRAIGEDAKKDAGIIAQRQMDNAFVTPKEGFLSRALNRLNFKPEGEKQKDLFKPPGLYDSEVISELDINKPEDYKAINTKANDLFLNRSKVKTIDDYTTMLERFMNKNTFEAVKGSMIKGKVWDVKTRIKLEETGRVMRAHKENDANYLEQKYTELLEYRAEIWRLNDVNREPSRKEEEFNQENPDAPVGAYEQHVRDWITALGPVEIGQEYFTTNWETHKKALFNLEKRGRDTFKEIQNAKEQETLSNIQMALDVMEGTGKALGRKPFLARLFGIDAEYGKNKWYSGLNLRTLNQWGTANIYSLAEDLSINHAESGTFDSPLVNFVQDNMRSAQNTEFISKRSVLNILANKLKEINSIDGDVSRTSINPLSAEGPLSRQEGRVLNRLRQIELKNTKEQEVDWVDEETGTAGSNETWTPNEAANLYIKTLDATNYRTLEKMGIMKRTYNLKERYKTFKEFTESQDFLNFQIKLTGGMFAGESYRTVEEALEVIKKPTKKEREEGIDKRTKAVAEILAQERKKVEKVKNALDTWENLIKRGRYTQKEVDYIMKRNEEKKKKNALKAKPRWHSIRKRWESLHYALEKPYKYSPAEQLALKETYKQEAQKQIQIIDDRRLKELEESKEREIERKEFIYSEVKKAYESDDNPDYGLTNKGEAILNLVDPQLRQWSDYLVNEFFPTYATGELFPGHLNLNDFHIDITGAPLNHRKFYSPAPKDVEMGVNEGEINVSTPEIVFNEMQSSHLKEKSANKQPLRKQDINVMVTKFVQDMEFFKAYQKPISSLHKVFNNKKVKEKIRTDFAPGLHSVINRNILDIAGKNKLYNRLQTTLTKARTNYVVGSLGAKPSLMFKQATSILAYAGDMPTAEWVKTTASLLDPGPEGAISNWRNAYNTLMELPAMQKRYSRLEFDDAVRQVMGSEFENIPSHNKAVRKQLINAMMKPVIIGDRFAIVAGGWAVYEHNRKKALAEGKSPEEAVKFAEKRFESATNLAQQASDSPDLSIMQRNPYMKMFAMYKTSPMSYYRQSRAAMRALSASKGSSKEAAKKLLIYNYILPNLFQAVTTTFKYNKDKYIMNVDDGELDDQTKFSYDFYEMMRMAMPFTPDEISDKYGAAWKAQKRATYLGSANGIAIAGDVFTYLLNTFIEDSNYGFDAVPMASAVEAFGRGGKKLYDEASLLQNMNDEGIEINWSDYVEALEAINKVADPAMTLSGVPYRGTFNFAEGLYNLLHSEESYYDPSDKIVPFGGSQGEKIVPYDN